MATEDTACRHWRTNVVVIGSGVAGLACALALAPTPVIVITKTASPVSGSTALAQGGIAAALGTGDTPEQHARDTISAGAGLVDEERALMLAREGAAAVRHLIASGVHFDRKRDGTLSLGREAAHGKARIVHAGGDATGRNLSESLVAMALATPTIRVVSDAFVLDLIAQRGRIGGVVAVHKSFGRIQIHANAVVLASGGIGGLWLESTTPSEATGDGLALAARAGARMADLEFMQFHPTALLPRQARPGERLALLTEALRGAGAVLLDAAGRRFMPAEHPLAELAPRDVVARAIAKRRTQGEPVFLDLRPALAGGGAAAFPQALRLCRQAGYEPTRDPMPITPATHYHMGGVATDMDGHTTLEGLWACGEVACTGVHGANRLASNSLLEGLVFGARVAASIRSGDGSFASAVDTPRALLPAAPLPLDALGRMRRRVRAIMTLYAGLLRDGSGLARAAAELVTLEADLQRLTAASADDAAGAATAGRPANDFPAIVAWGEMRNMLLAARLVVHCAERRTESRGAHYRRDYPQADEGWQHRQLISLTALDHRLPAATPPLRANTAG
ncbi:MAG: L-aspartate oxidase [Defluviicoccus sp.]